MGRVKRNKERQAALFTPAMLHRDFCMILMEWVPTLQMGASRYDARIGGGGGHGKADVEREVA